MPTAPVAVTGFSHVAISVTDLDAARGFYCGILGFDELPRPDLGIPGMWLGVGDLQLHFVETDEMPKPGRGFPHYALHVPTARFESTMETLRRAGVPFLGEPSSRGRLRHDRPRRLRHRPRRQRHRAHRRRAALTRPRRRRRRSPQCAALTPTAADADQGEPRPESHDGDGDALSRRRHR